MSNAEIITKNVENEFNKFKEKELSLSQKEIFNDSNLIHFYK